MEYSWVLCVALGAVLVGTSYHNTRLERQISILNTEKQYLESNYKAEKELWENTIQEQNLKIERYMANTQAYICTVNTKKDDISSKTNTKQIAVAKSIAVDSSSANQLSEIGKLLHEFSENK